MLPERAARPAPSGSGRTVVDLPFGVGPLVESLLWHPLHERDPAHIWLRKIAAEAGHLVAVSTAETDPRDLSRRRSAGNRDLIERFIHRTKSL
ncbi:hypothetical protein [Streptomyces cavernae]|uniref:hypothetical protein n=1 Tax=Streptomyces cavernae TaxID=2259034 RepID=UPI000FEC01A2|nr:hypothetical protein [Streptomyces cavernae]